MPARKPYRLKKCARNGCANPVKGWQGRKKLRRVPVCVYRKRLFCSKRCAAKPKSCGWRSEADEMTTTSRAWTNAIDGTMYGRRCAWSECGALLVRKRVKSGEYESAANWRRRTHCDATHAALAMRQRGLRGIADAMMRRAELHP